MFLKKRTIIDLNKFTAVWPLYTLIRRSQRKGSKCKRQQDEEKTKLNSRAWIVYSYQLHYHEAKDARAISGN